MASSSIQQNPIYKLNTDNKHLWHERHMQLQKFWCNGFNKLCTYIFPRFSLLLLISLFIFSSVPFTLSYVYPLFLFHHCISYLLLSSNFINVQLWFIVLNILFLFVCCYSVLLLVSCQSLQHWSTWILVHPLVTCRPLESFISSGSSKTSNIFIFFSKYTLYIYLTKNCSNPIFKYGKTKNQDFRTKIRQQ